MSTSLSCSVQYGHTYTHGRLVYNNYISHAAARNANVRYHNTNPKPNHIPKSNPNPTTNPNPIANPNSMRNTEKTYQK